MAFPSALGSVLLLGLCLFDIACESFDELELSPIFPGNQCCLFGQTLRKREDGIAGIFRFSAGELLRLWESLSALRWKQRSAFSSVASLLDCTTKQNAFELPQ